MSGDATPLTFGERLELIGWEEALGDGAGGVVAIGFDQPHPDLEAGGGEDATEGFDRG